MMGYKTKLNHAFYKVDRDRIWQEQGEKCFYCSTILKRNEATMDRVIPMSSVGIHSTANTVVACRWNKYWEKHGRWR